MNNIAQKTLLVAAFSVVAATAFAQTPGVDLKGTVGYVIDQLNDFFRHVVTWSGFTADDDATVRPVCSVAALDAVIEMNDMQNV